jgi:integrase
MRKGDGLYLRGQTWYLDCRLNGRRCVRKLGKLINRTTAGELASIERAKFLKGEAGIGRKKKDVLFDAAREKFLEWTETNTKPRTVRDYRLCLTQLQKSFDGKRLSQIGALDVERHKHSRVKAGAKVRPNREIAVLKHLYNKAKAWKLYEGENPVIAVKKLKEPKQRLRYLEAEEEGRLLAASPEPLHSLITVGINTGLRIEAEALPLRWQDVDIRRGFLTVQAAYAKNGTTRTIELNSRAREALHHLKATARSEYVFSQRNGQPYQSIEKPFAEACRRAKLSGTGVTPHTLRHTFCSRLVQAGVDLRTVQELGGWRDLSMVQRYAHLSPSHKAQAVERIAEEFHNAIHNTFLEHARTLGQ